MINIEGVLIPPSVAGLTTKELRAYQRVVDVVLQSPDLPVGTLVAFAEAGPVVEAMNKHLARQEEIQELRERAYEYRRDNNSYGRRAFLGKAVKTAIGLGILGGGGYELYNTEFSAEAKRKQAASELAKKKEKEATQILGLGTSDISHTGWTVQLPSDAETTHYIPVDRPPQFIHYDKSDYQYIKFVNPDNAKKTDSTDMTLKSYISSGGVPMTEIHIITDSQNNKTYRLLPIQPDANDVPTSGVIEMVNQEKDEIKYIKIDPIQGSPNHFKVTELQK